MLEFIWIRIILSVVFRQIKRCKNQHYQQVSLVMFVQGVAVGLIQWQNYHTYVIILPYIFRCYVLTQGSKIIKRGLATKEGCDDNDGSLLKNVLTALKQSLNDDSITKTCCSWSCCNYNSTTVALTSAPTSLNISSSGLVYEGNKANTIYFAHNLQLILLFVIPLVLIYMDFV